MKGRGNMGLLLILLSGLFFFDPIVAFVDVLPNCIGYVLLYLGLFRLSDLNGHLWEARKKLRIMLFVGAGQLFGTYFIYAILGGMMEQKPAEMSRFEVPMATLLCSFVLLVLQWYFFLPAMKEFFAGMDRLAESHGAEALGAEKRGKTPSTRMFRLTVCFIIASSLLSALPEASVLTSYEAYKGNPWFPFDWYEFIVLLRGVAAVISFAVGLVWLIAFVRYMQTARRDTAWVERLQNTYRAEVLPQTGMLTVRRFSAAFAVLLLGLLFFIDLRVNYRTVLPGLGLAAGTVAGLWILGKDAPRRRACFVLSGCLAAVSVLQLLLSSRYLSLHLPEASLYESDAYVRFLYVRAADAVEAILALLLVGALLRTLYGTVQMYTEVQYETEGSQSLSYAATEKLHREFRGQLIIVFALFAMASVCSVAYAIFRLTLPWMWLPALACSLVGVGKASSFLRDLRTQIQFKYRSDGMNKNI